MFGNLFDIHHGKPCKSISFTGENELKGASQPNTIVFSPFTSVLSNEF
jgi:hypothetical protein